MTSESVLRQFDRADYPRRYRASMGWLIYGVLSSGLAGVLVLVGAWYFGIRYGVGSPGQEVAVVAIGLAIALYCAIDVIDSLSFSVILDADAIEVRRLWGTRRLQRNQIADYQFVRKRRHRGLAPRTLVLLPRGQTQRALKLPWVVQSDPPFLRWLASLRKD